MLPPVSDTRPILIDGDALAYRAGYQMLAQGLRPEDTVHNLLSTVTWGLDGQVFIHMTPDEGSKGGRYLVARRKPYQGNRAAKVRPPEVLTIRNYITNSLCDVFVTTTGDCEADDTLADQARSTPSLIVSPDKDFRCLRGEHIGWVTGRRVVVDAGWVELTGNTVAAKQSFAGPGHVWLQMLEGDAADNIPGLPYVTEKSGKQRKIGHFGALRMLLSLTDPLEMAQRVYSEYVNTYGVYRAPSEFAEQLYLLSLTANRRDIPSVHPGLRDSNICEEACDNLDWWGTHGRPA